MNRDEFGDGRDETGTGATGRDGNGTDELANPVSQLLFFKMHHVKIFGCLS